MTDGASPVVVLAVASAAGGLVVAAVLGVAGLSWPVVGLAGVLTADLTLLAAAVGLAQVRRRPSAGGVLGSDEGAQVRRREGTPARPLPSPRHEATPSVLRELAKAVATTAAAEQHLLQAARRTGAVTDGSLTAAATALELARTHEARARRAAGLPVPRAERDRLLLADRRGLLEPSERSALEAADLKR